MNLTPDIDARIVDVVVRVALRSNVTSTDLMKSRYKGAARSRQLAMYILFCNCSVSRRSIALGFGRKGRTCVTYAVEKISRLLLTDRELARVHSLVLKDLGR